ncbi:MAG: ArsB/NhaD family transporter [Candidatus Cloacimonetes bacterium]|nr:ArsB/NhaD family transporter [Candidatus Cloacimonadota bacterium]
MTEKMFFGLAIFIGCYVFIASEKINKVAVALSGAVLFIFLGYVSQNQAFSTYIDWNVIFLLIGMMIMMGVIKNTGLFEFIAIFLAKKARGNPKKIIIMLFIITGVFSAFLDNVTTVIVIAPISILIAVELGISPIPFVITQALASNIGGAATLIGDPPNLMIGSAAGLSFLDFLKNLGVFIAITMVVCAFIVNLFFGKQLKVTNERRARIMEFKEKELIRDKSLLIYSIVVFGIFLTLLILQEVLQLHAATIALVAAVLLLLRARKINMENFLSNEIDWSSILFFIGLFIMVGALEEIGIIHFFSEKILDVSKGNMELTTIFIIWSSGIASAFLDNIPFVAAMIPMIRDVSQSIGVEQALPLWWALSLGSCLGGNGTLIGASANIISAGICKKSNYPISFWTFTKYGAVITLINLLLASVFMILRYF